MSTHTSPEVVKLGYMRQDIACKAFLPAAEQRRGGVSSPWLLHLLMSDSPLSSQALPLNPHLALAPSPRYVLAQVELLSLPCSTSRTTARSR